MGIDLLPLALSVRQPWAWAIIHGGKIIENRSAGSIRAGNMDCRRIAIHAASAMREKEYQWGAWRLKRHGVTCPRPEDLVRRAIIGSVNVVDIVSESDSEWFGGPMGLVLDNPKACEPFPAVGELGYFKWVESGAFAPILPWMRAFDGGDNETLFPDEPMSFRQTPAHPRRKT